MGGWGGIAGTALGAGVGSIFGPAGVAKGMAIGSTLGALIDALTTKPPHQPGDSRWPGASYGDPIPRVWNSFRVSARLMYATRNTNGTYIFDTGAPKKGGVDHFSASFGFIVAQSGYTFLNGGHAERAIAPTRVLFNDLEVWHAPPNYPAAPANWNSGTTYAAGGQAKGSDGNSYTSLQNGNLNHNPTSQPSTWWQPNEFDKWISAYTYFAGDYVYGSDNNLYFSMADGNTGNDPTVQPSNWWALGQNSTRDADIVWHPAGTGTSAGPTESVFTQAVDSYISSQQGTANTCAYRGLTYGVLQGFDCYNIGNSIPQSIVIEGQTITTYGLDTILGDLCQMAGLATSDYNFSGVSSIVPNGYMLESTCTAQDAINNLLAGYALDLVQVDGVIQAVQRGGSSVFAIPDTELSAAQWKAKQPDRFGGKGLADAAELHNLLSFGYRDQTDQYRKAHELSLREGVGAYNPGVIDTDIVMTPTQAAQNCGRLHDSEFVESGGEWELSLPTYGPSGNAYGALTPTDCFTANDLLGNSQRFRVLHTDWLPDLVKLTVARDETEVLNRYEVGDGGTSPIVKTGRPVATAFYAASTDLDFSDGSSNYPGFYYWGCPMGSSTSDWPGFQVDYTFDAPGGTRNWISGPTSQVQSFIGTGGMSSLVAGTIGYQSADYFNVNRGNGTPRAPSDLAEAAVQNGQQWAYVQKQSAAYTQPNWEIIGIVNATDNGSGSNAKIGAGLIRGIRGTNMEAQQTSAGTVCMAPSVAQMVKVQVDVSRIGQTCYVRCYTIGMNRLDSAGEAHFTIQQNTPTNTSQAPMQPTSISAGTPNYSGLTESIQFSVVLPGTPPTGQLYNWKYSTNGGSSWTAGPTNSGPTYTPPGFTSGTMEVEAQPVLPTQTGTYVTSANQTYATPSGSTAVAPDSVSATVTGYSGATENISFAPVYTTHSPASGQTYQSQYSLDGGTTWKGPDGTSATYFTDNPHVVGISSGTVEMQYRAVASVGGATTAWVQSSNQTYAAPATGSTGSYVIREVPSGSINGSNTTFTLANTPISGSESVYLNGRLMNVGGSNDYTISGATITMVTVPQTSDVLLVSYWH